MSLSIKRRKSVSLTFRGFDITAEEVADLLGVAASRLGNRGEPVKLGVMTRLTRSYTIFSMDFVSDCELNDMLPALLARLGGLSHLLQVRNVVQPEFLEIHFELPVRESDEVQDGYLSEAVVADVFQLKASLSFGFF
jgi:hypothetical protein